MIVPLDALLVTMAVIALASFSAGLLLGLYCGGTRRADDRLRSSITQSFERAKRGE